MHEALIHRSRKNLDASVAAVEWTSTLQRGFEEQARQAGYEGRLSQDCLDELQTFLTGLLEAQHDRCRREVRERTFRHDWSKIKRRERDELTQEVYGQLVDLRGLVRSLLGKNQEANLFGAGRKTPREPKELVRVASNVAGFLRNDRAEEQICRGLANAELWRAAVEKMSGPLEKLSTVLLELRREASHERAAVTRLHEAKDRLHRTQLHLFRLQESLLTLAGLDDLAEDLRPTVPAPRRRATEAPEAVHPTSNALGSLPEASEVALDAVEAVPDRDGRSETAAFPVSPVESPSEASIHPVRKVLDWFQTVPHRVRNATETSETEASEVRAA